MLNESGCNLRAQPGSCDHSSESRKRSRAHLPATKEPFVHFLRLFSSCALLSYATVPVHASASLLLAMPMPVTQLDSLSTT